MSLLILLAAWVAFPGGGPDGGVRGCGEKRSADIVVVIDAGHGGEDPGKVSGSGTLEKDINLAIALRLERMLQAADVKTVMTRRADEGWTAGKTAAKRWRI